MSPFRRRSIRRRLLGMAATAGTAWLFDPKEGASRRQQLRSQVSEAMGRVQNRAGRPSVDPSSITPPVGDLQYGTPSVAEAVGDRSG